MTAAEAALHSQLIRLLALPEAGSSDFDLSPGVVLDPNRRLRAAAVLLAVVGPPERPALLMTKRASGLRHHPGQVAFPGGKHDESDASLVSTALREAFEETGLPPDSVTILGALPPHETVTGFRVTPILARVTQPFIPRLDPAEVAEVFTVPLAHVLDIGRYSIQRRMWRGGWRRYYTIPWGPWYIWGATAQILRALAGHKARADTETK